MALQTQIRDKGPRDCEATVDTEASYKYVFVAKVDLCQNKHCLFVGIRLIHGLHGMFYQVDCSTSCQLPGFVLPIA